MSCSSSDIDFSFYRNNTSSTLSSYFLSSFLSWWL